MASTQVDAAQETTEVTPVIEEKVAKPTEETEAQVQEEEKEEKPDEETETDDWMTERTEEEVAASPIIEEVAPAANLDEAEAEAEEDDEIDEE